jgi:GTP-binding protein
VNLPVIALVGRPNVGKSQLFNRIVGENNAIVSDEPGTTRDRHFARAEWNGRQFWLVDTGGLADDPHMPMDLEIKRQVLQAIEESDLLMLVVDAKIGRYPATPRWWTSARRGAWILAANKVDDPATTISTSQH